MRVLATRELIVLHQKRREIPEFAKWWARYVEMVFAMKYSRLNVAYTEEELEEVLTRAFAALPPELKK
jgi:hypothetical protein